MNKLKAVKIVVFILTFLLVFGLLSMLGLLFQKAKNRSQITDNRSQITLNEPYGSTITDAKVNGGLLYLTVKQGGESDRIIIFDTAAGKPVSKIKLH